MEQDIRDIVTGSPFPMTVEDIALDAAVWPIPKGQPRRPVSTTEALSVLQKLHAEGAVRWIDGRGWFRPEPPKMPEQKTLF